MTTRIVVGVDSSPASHAALRWAFAQAAHDGHNLLAVHIIDVEGRPEAAAAHDPLDAGHDVASVAQGRVLSAIRDLDSDVRVTISTPHGSLLSSLVEAATDADTIVVGAPQHAEHMTLPDQLASLCCCRVVQVSEDGTATPLSGDHALSG